MKTILFIEDNHDILENLTEFMMLEGYKVLAANSGKMGLEFANTFIPDLIICDILMSEMDGHEVLRLLLETDKTYEIPFIFSTSKSDTIDRTKSMALGADGYIVKPYVLEDLLILTETWIKSGTQRSHQSSTFVLGCA